MDLNSRLVDHIKDVPVKDKNRNCTDLFCTIVNTVFVLIMLIIAIVLYNNYELIKMSLPNDDEGNVCGFEQAHNHTILFYPDYNDPVQFYVILQQQTRVCVNRCPDKGSSRVSCFPTKETPCSSLVPVQTNTEFQYTRIGLFCFPEDQAEKDILLDKIGLTERYHFLGYYDAMWRSFYISSILAVIFVILVQFFPLKMVPWTILIGGVFALLFGILIMVLSTGNIILRILFVLIMIGLAAACAFTLFQPSRRKQVFIAARLVEASTVVLKENPLTAIYIPIFIIFLFILLVLCGFETLGAWSFSTFNFDQNYPYFRLSGAGSVILQILIAIEFLWGLCFLKQACNFCISGVSTQWYYFRRDKKSDISVFRSIKNLFRYHWGSVLGCALLTGSLYILDFITDFFFNSDSTQRKESIQYHSLKEQKKYENKRGCFDFLNLCRSETMSYINLVSIPYCNAARYCEQLSSNSQFYNLSQTTNRVYRLSAHILLMSLVTFISLMTVKSYSGQGDISGIFGIAIITIFTTTFFISLHGDLAEGLLISIFVQEAFFVDDNQVHDLTIPQDLVKDIYYDDTKEKYEKKTIKDLLFGLTKQSHNDKDDIQNQDQNQNQNRASNNRSSSSSSSSSNNRSSSSSSSSSSSNSKK